MRSWFAKAIQLNPYLPYAQAGFGMCLDWLGRPQEAELRFKLAVKLDPNGARTLAYLGWHYFQVKDYENAKKWLQFSLHLSQDEKINPMASPYLKYVEEKLNEAGGTAPP